MTGKKSQSEKCVSGVIYLNGYKTYRLPEGQENDQLDCGNLQERLILCHVLAHLDVELNQTVHGNRDCSRFNNKDLVAR